MSTERDKVDHVVFHLEHGGGAAVQHGDAGRAAGRVVTQAAREDHVRLAVGRGREREGGVRRGQRAGAAQGQSYGPSGSYQERVMGFTAVCRAGTPIYGQVRTNLGRHKWAKYVE